MDVILLAPRISAGEPVERGKGKGLSRATDHRHAVLRTNRLRLRRKVVMLIRPISTPVNTNGSLVRTQPPSSSLKHEPASLAR